MKCVEGFMDFSVRLNHKIFHDYLMAMASLVSTYAVCLVVNNFCWSDIYDKNLRN